MAFVFRYPDFLVDQNIAEDSISQGAQSAAENLAAMLPRQIESLHLVCHAIEHLTLLLVGIEAVLSSVEQGQLPRLRLINIDGARSAEVRSLMLQENGRTTALLPMRLDTLDMLKKLKQRGHDLNIVIRWFNVWNVYEPDEDP